MSAPIFGITGWKNSGKTTLLTNLVTEFSSRGLRVSTVKHAHHAFDIDHPGRDSFRHREAGAVEVALVSGKRWVIMHELRNEEEPSLTEALGRMSACDLILIEGYKREDHPKIEVRRSDGKEQQPMADSDPTIAAIAADYEIKEAAKPVFDLNDIKGLADFISQFLKLD